ncbi:MAG: hypothetical protein Q8S21_00470 [Candidatus Paracaedibacteraceae bacterium]|nr:hypothetical protein [Candidatus Paracaedibacteraceae bacterium]
MSWFLTIHLSLFITVMPLSCLMAGSAQQQSSTTLKTTIPAKASSTMTTVPTSTKPGETFSLMLSDAEEKIISDALAHDKRINDDATTCFYLGGIVFSTPANWTLWLNDKAYTNESDISDIKILNVSKDSVNIKSKVAKNKHGALIKTNQTFCNDTGNVSDGDHRR